jgi:uncharacterized membrane protein
VDATLLVIASFLASAVEVVEALTIVLAVGVTRGWRAALAGASSASLLLLLVVSLLGPAIVLAIPIRVLQTVVGVLLVMFGTQWLRKAIERRAGLRDLHDEARIFERDIREFAAAPVAAGFDWNGFTLSFKGVFLEGLEVAFIVLTFGTNGSRLALASLGAAVAFVLVVGVGIAVRRPLQRVPENDLKFVVGLLLCAFGTFWLGEGAGIEWPLEDVMIVAFAVFYGAAATLLVATLRRRPGIAAAKS